MLIAHDSVLRRIPVGLDRRQQIVLDGLRIAVDIIDLSRRRLIAGLLALPTLEQGTQTYVEAAASANLDAWTIVDNAYRFAQLLQQFPLIKQNLPQFQLLYRATATAESMRHYIQHVRNEVDSLAKAGFSVWGSITWNLKADFLAGRPTTRSLNMGTFYEGNLAPVGSIPASVEQDIDNIALRVGDLTMSLTDAIRKIEFVVRGLEQDLEQQAGQLPRHSSDVLFALTLLPTPKEGARTKVCAK